MKRLLVPTSALMWGLQMAFLSPALALILVNLYGATTAEVGWVLSIYNASGFGEPEERWQIFCEWCGVSDLRKGQFVAVVEQRCEDGVLIFTFHAIAEDAIVEQRARYILQVE